MADADLTPLTSVSSNGFSTQGESQSSIQAATEKAGIAKTENVAAMPLAYEASNGSFLKPQPMSPAKAKIAPRPEPVHGQKRNAAGEVKLPSSGTTLRTPDISRFFRGHSRTISADSNGSKIAEVKVSE
jgi:hypothetical protein